MLSSQDHDRDAADEARYGRHWMDVGTGGWDPQGRPSEVRLDRLLHLRRDGVRREGAALPRPVFDEVVAARAGAVPAVGVRTLWRTPSAARPSEGERTGAGAGAAPSARVARR